MYMSLTLHEFHLSECVDFRATICSSHFGSFGFMVISKKLALISQ